MVSLGSDRRFSSSRPPDKGFRRPLYSVEERRRRDATPWTLVQGILAPVQFLVFLVSSVLVARYLLTGEGYVAATASVLVKTAILYTIMITGALWEKAVFGRYLLAPAFFWEDMVSFAVIAVHTAYVVALIAGVPGPAGQMAIAVVAYGLYLVNAAQFVFKLRQARLQVAA